MKEEQEFKKPMDAEEFAEKLHNHLYDENGIMRLYLVNYDAVKRFKSVRRAIRRGLVSPQGYIYPKRPFGNTRTKMNDIKRSIYYGLKKSGKKAR